MTIQGHRAVLRFEAAVCAENSPPRTLTWRLVEGDVLRFPTLFLTFVAAGSSQKMLLLMQL